jgi:thiosulfate/3-mercaptopyruvate sulfurtransferase
MGVRTAAAVYRVSPLDVLQEWRYLVDHLQEASNMRFSAAAAIAALLLLPAAASAQVANGSSRDKLVVSTAWLAEHLTDRDLVVLQVGRKATYDTGHVPGARLVDFDGGALHGGHGMDGGLTLEMPAAEDLRTQLAALGIANDSRIVVVAADNYWSPSTRVMLTLDYAGLDNVSWLDGGLGGWTAAGRSLSAAAPPAKTGTLAPLKIRPVVVDAAFVQSHVKTPGFVVVDARNTPFYDGTRAGGTPPTAGHIPGAVSAPFDQFARGDDAKGETWLKPAAEIEALFASAGVKPGDTVVAYCHIGQQATATLFAARSVGHNVLLYDGSFQDWSKRGLPVENPKKEK